MIRVKKNWLGLYCDGENYGDIAIEEFAGVNGPIAHVHCEIYIWNKRIARRLMKDRSSGYKYLKKQGYCEIMSTQATMDKKWIKFCKLLGLPSPIACTMKEI